MKKRKKNFYDPEVHDLLSKIQDLIQRKLVSKCQNKYVVNAPTPNEKASVSDVIIMEMAASLIHSPIRLETGYARFVCRTAATIRNILSVPTATSRNGITPMISLDGTPEFQSVIR